MSNNTPFFTYYSAARENFLWLATERNAATASYVLPNLEAPDGKKLSIDLAWFGPQNAENILLISSGVHGVEGPAGSVIQREWMYNADRVTICQKHAVVLVHAVNPYGFAYSRRGNENNIDLNRNFITFPVARDTNHPYHILAAALSPERALRLLGLGTNTGIAWFLAKHSFGKLMKDGASEGIRRLFAASFKDLKDGLTAGQYDYPDGLFYGGKEKSWSRKIWEEILATRLAGAKRIIHIDIHTGLGKSGAMQMMMTAPQNSVLHKAATTIWPDQNIAVLNRTQNNSLSSYVSGDIFESWSGSLPHVKVLAAAAEFGTVAPTKILKALCFENAAHFQPDLGFPNEEARASLADAFIPQSSEWRNAVRKTGVQVVNAACEAIKEDFKLYL